MSSSYFGIASFVSKGEDATASYSTHSSNGISNLSSFGVYDGHYGDFASKSCSQHLHLAVVSRFRSSLMFLKEFKFYILSSGEKKDLANILGSELIVEALLCEAIRSASQVMDAEVRRLDKSGTTAVSIYLRRLSNGNTRLVCSNIGDSRCIVFSPDFSEIKRCSSIDSIKVSPIAVAKYHRGNSYEKLFKVTKSKIVPVAISTDHNLLNKSERERVLGDISSIQNTAPWGILPKNTNEDVIQELIHTSVEFSKILNLASVNGAHLNDGK